MASHIFCWLGPACLPVQQQAAPGVPVCSSLGHKNQTAHLPSAGIPGAWTLLGVSILSTFAVW